MHKSYLVALFAALLVACSSSEPTGKTYSVDTSQWEPNHNVGFYMTDQVDVSLSAGVAVNVDTFSHVYVTVTEVHLNATEGDSGWTSFKPVNPVRLDLLALQNDKTALLISGNIAAATYHQVRLVLSSTEGDNYVVLAKDGSRHNLATPSASQSGLKIKNLNVTIDAETKAAFILDFIASESIVSQGNGGYSLKPVIMAHFGKVSSEGTSVDATLKGSAYINR